MEKSKCQNCGEVHKDEDLKVIDRLTERVGPGEPMPSGECPGCGSLCQPHNPQAIPGPYEAARSNDPAEGWQVIDPASDNGDAIATIDPMNYFEDLDHDAEKTAELLAASWELRAMLRRCAARWGKDDDADNPALGREMRELLQRVA